MGDGIAIECTNCDYERAFMLGVGFRYFNVEELMDAIHPAYRQRLQEICRDHPDHRDELEERMYRCPKCESLFGHLYFRIEFGDSQVFERPMKCSRCRCDLERIEDPDAALPTLRCPDCKQYTLTRSAEMLWD